MSLKSLLTRFKTALSATNEPAPKAELKPSEEPASLPAPFNEVAQPVAPQERASRPASNLALSLTITSDVGGTIVKPNMQYNIPLLTYLFDAAEKGHDVIICSMGNMESVEDSIMIAERVLKRACPPSIRLMNKWQLRTENIVPDIAFDDLDFGYLPDRPTVYSVTMDKEGEPSVPWAKLRAIAGLKDNNDPAPAPAP